MREGLVTRTGFAICEAFGPGRCQKLCGPCKKGAEAAIAAIAALPQQPAEPPHCATGMDHQQRVHDERLQSRSPQPAALPAEPPPGTVRVRIGVIVDADGIYDCDKLNEFDRVYYDTVPDAILVADVRPLTPPEIAATVEGGR